VEVCNLFPKWGWRDQKRKFVFADNKIILMSTSFAILLPSDGRSKSKHSQTGIHEWVGRKELALTI
jgi:hypothetical protein